MKEIETFRMDEVTCPYCGYANQDSWELAGKQEEIQETECESCERDFIYTTLIDICYTSKKKDSKP